MSRKPILLLMHGELSAGYLLEVLTKLDMPYQICNGSHGDVPPEDMDAFSGIAIMGGMMASYEQDKYPWLSREIGWIERFVETGKPALGICLGCQILTHIYDGEVFSGEKGLNVGFKRIELLDDDPVFGNELEGCRVPVYHGDTYTLPEDAQRMARGYFYYEQAVKFGENVYGTQFHPETTIDIMHEWYGYALLDPRSAKGMPTLEDFIAQGQKHIPCVHSWLEKFVQRLFG